MVERSEPNLSMRRSAALSACMILLFVGSLGIASLLTDASSGDVPDLPLGGPPSNQQPLPIAEPAPTPTQTQVTVRWVNLGGMSIPTPASWNLAPQQIERSWEELTDQSVILADPNRPTRRLRIGYINTPEGTSGAEVYDRLLGEDRSYFEPLDQNIRPFFTTTHSGGILAREVQVRIQSDDGRVDRMANSLIALCVLSPNNDGRRFWVIYFSDLLPSGADGQRLAKEGYGLVTLAGRYARPTPEPAPEAEAP